MSKRGRILLVLLFTMGFLALVLWGLDLDKARVALAATDWGFLLPMSVCYLVAHSLRSWRLQLILGRCITPAHGGEARVVPFRRVFAINSMGFLAINVVPLRLGEAVRPYLLMEREGAPFGRSLAAIFVERILDMLMLLGMLLGLTLLVDLPTDGLQVHGVDIIGLGQRVASIAVIGGVLGILGIIGLGERAIGWLRLLPAGERLAGFAGRFRTGLLDLAGRPLHALLILVLSVALWVVTIFAVNLVLAAVPGMPSGLGPAWTLWAITLTGMALVPTPGFFGGYELFCSSSMLLWGVDLDLARTFAVILHLAQFAFTIALGTTFLVLEGLSLRRLVSSSQMPLPKTT